MKHKKLLTTLSYKVTLAMSDIYGEIMVIAHGQIVTIKSTAAAFIVMSFVRRYVHILEINYVGFQIFLNNALL